MTNRRTLLLAGGAVAVVTFVIAVIIIGPSDFFLPEESTQVEETPMEGGDVVNRGSFVGAAGHDVSGTVLLMRDAEGLYLRFENYSQTQGPDVFVYVTPSSTPDTQAEIAAGTKILIDGGADGGESTKEGTFTQRLPESVSASNISGVGIWCDQFDTPFGYAELSSHSG